MALLEANEMNMSATAREVRVTRQCIFQWKQKYWNAYLNNKDEVRNEVRDIEAVKFSTVKEFDVLRNICTKTFKLALERSIEILEDKEKLKKLSNRDLIELIKTIAPYAAEKVGLSGTETPLSPSQDHTTFIQNIIQQLNYKGIRNMRNDNKQDKV